MTLSRKELASIADFCARTSDDYLARQIEVHESYIVTVERYISMDPTADALIDDLACMRETLSIELAEQTRRAR